ncbi:MAG: PEP-CTERM sorting domain-containing protein [Planctomycetaceae bacterium]
MRNPLFLVAVAVVLLGEASELRAEFVLTNLTAAGTVANSGTIQDQIGWTAYVGPETVVVTTNTGSNSSVGNTTVQSSDNAILKTVAFTPANPNLFDMFSFTGSLSPQAGGDVYIQVFDNQGNPSETFLVSGLNSSNIGTIGIIAAPGSNQTIKSVYVTSKWGVQGTSSFGISAVPAPPAIALLGSGALTAGLFFRRRKAAH